MLKREGRRWKSHRCCQCFYNCSQLNSHTTIRISGFFPHRTVDWEFLLHKRLGQEKKVSAQFLLNKVYMQWFCIWYPCPEPKNVLKSITVLMASSGYSTSKGHQIMRSTQQEEDAWTELDLSPEVLCDKCPLETTWKRSYKHKEPGAGVWLGAEHLLDWHARGPGSIPSVTNVTFLFAFSLIYITW